jgi:hypothetical protein
MQEEDAPPGGRDVAVWMFSVAICGAQRLDRFR